MFRVLLADDEVFIIDMLKQLIDWDGLRLELVGEAHNGLDAYEQICKHEPDIVIVDIRMPGYDGIALVETVKKLGIPAHFIFVSGHRQFEYAKFAVEEGIEGYLLKPINGDELNALLQKITAKISENEGALQQYTQAQNDLQVSKGQIKRQMLEKMLLFDDIALSSGELAAQYDFEPSTGSVWVAVIKTDDMREDVMLESMRFLYTHVLQLKKELFCCLDGETIALRMKGKIVLMLNHALSDKELLTKLSNLLEQAKTHLELFDVHHVTVCVGAKQHTLETVQSSYLSAMQLMAMRNVLGTNRIITHENLCTDTVPMEVLDKNEYKDLARAIQLSSANDIASLVENAFAQRMDSFRAQPLLFSALVRELTSVFFAAVRKSEADQPEPETAKAALRQQLENCFTVQQTVQMLVRSFTENLALYNLGTDENSHAAVRLAKKYIEENYQQKISLQTVADMVYHNPVYLSIVFKKITGVNFKEYLIHIRIEKAKELLTDLHLSVSEISGLVGYVDVRHFSSIFKKIVGVTPKQYRNLRS